MEFDDAFTALELIEGGYSNDPQDPGGETMYGITARLARAYGYTGAMRDLPLIFAQSIARREFWTPLHCDELPADIRYDVFDCAYNNGSELSATCLQTAAKCSVDGKIGPATVAAVNAAPVDQIRRLFNAERLMAYTSLAGWDHDGKGWARRVATNLKR